MLELFCKFIDFVHCCLIFFPFYMMFIPNIIVKLFFLLSALTPLGWLIFNGKCWMTLLVEKIMGEKNKEYKKSFSERYLGWFYFRILDLVQIENTSENLDKLVTWHWVLNNIAVWYYVFFVNCSC